MLDIDGHHGCISREAITHALHPDVHRVSSDSEGTPKLGNNVSSHAHVEVLNHERGLLDLPKDSDSLLRSDGPVIEPCNSSLEVSPPRGILHARPMALPEEGKGSSEVLFDIQALPRSPPMDFTVPIFSVVPNGDSALPVLVQHKKPDASTVSPRKISVRSWILPHSAGR